MAASHERLAEFGLESHRGKTKIVYRKHGDQRGSFEATSFTFPEFTFRSRGGWWREGVRFNALLPIVSKDALKEMSERSHSWRLHRRTTRTEADLAWLIRMISSVTRHCVGAHVALYATMSG